MFSSADEILSYIATEGVEFIDVRFTDLPGVQQHFNVPAAGFTADAFTEACSSTAPRSAASPPSTSPT